ERDRERERGIERDRERGIERERTSADRVTRWLRHSWLFLISLQNLLHQSDGSARARGRGRLEFMMAAVAVATVAVVMAGGRGWEWSEVMLHVLVCRI